MANPGRQPGLTGMQLRDPATPVPYAEEYLAPWDGPLRPARLPAAGAPLTAATVPMVAGPAIPPPTEDIDRASLITDWPMYANGPDPSYSGPPCGCCFFAAAAHGFTALRRYAGYAQALFSAQAVVGAYGACTGYTPDNPSSDQGTQAPQGLGFLRATGMLDLSGYKHTLAAWAAFKEPDNVPFLASALYAFGSVMLVIECDQAQEDQFSQGQPWEPVPSPSLGYHAVVLQRRRVGGIGVCETVTWGALQDATRAFLRVKVREAYIMVSADWLRANGTSLPGYNMAELLADMDSF